MPCLPLKNAQNESVGWLCGTGGRVVCVLDPVTGHGRRPWKWCYSCRKRSRHVLSAVLSDSPWYDPNVFWACGYCGKDETLFPGKFYD